MLHSKTFHRTLIGFVALILFLVIALPHTEEINVSATAKEYAMDVSSYQRDCHMIINGKYQKAFITDGFFDGIMDLEGVQGLDAEYNTVHLTFRGNVAAPVIKKSDGYMHSSQLYSVVYDDDHQDAIFVLYSKYQESNDRITASFDLSHAKFICVGDIRRDQAAAVLTKLYA